MNTLVNWALEDLTGSVRAWTNSAWEEVKMSLLEIISRDGLPEVDMEKEIKYDPLLKKMLILYD